MQTPGEEADGMNQAGESGTRIESRPMSGEILSARNIAKSYGDRLALKSLSFSLDAGRVLGFLGPNGAGKTTAIRILTTILPPSSGTFMVEGISSDEPVRIRRRIGVLPEGLGFPRQLSGLGYLTYFGRLYGRSSADAREVGSTLLAEVGLQSRATSPIDSYSHGMRQRLGIARALVNDPAVVFLDEPTLGLDPRGQRELLQLVRDVARDLDKGVVLSSHLLSEIEGVCDDVVIINAGEVVAKGTVDEVIGQTDGGGRGLLRIRVPTDAMDAAMLALRGAPGVLRVAVSGDAAGWLGVELGHDRDGSGIDEPRAGNGVLTALIQAGVPILGMDSGGGLQEVFLRLTSEAIS
jgi:ABC-2 type transport system ATP-binding protein